MTTMEKPQGQRRALTSDEMREVAHMLRRVVPKGQYEEHLLALFVRLYLSDAHRAA
jgi:hypothetical protein